MEMEILLEKISKCKYEYFQKNEFENNITNTFQIPSKYF
jgi:hypothetical protein